jgi:peptidoglycan/LPS O-acetylase OafA/YrhL
MPAAVEAVVAAFVSEHYVEQTFRKRKRDRADPEALARRDHLSDDGKP